MEEWTSSVIPSDIPNLANSALSEEIVIGQADSLIFIFVPFHLDFLPLP
jgi:hypothetical protein